MLCSDGYSEIWLLIKVLTLRLLLFLLIGGCNVLPVL